MTHTGTLRECPACADRLAQADALANRKLHKVYGKITRGSRQIKARENRHAKEIYNEVWKEHHAAVTA